MLVNKIEADDITIMKINVNVIRINDDNTMFKKFIFSSHRDVVLIHHQSQM